MSESHSQMNKIAAARAHRACCEVEHDPLRGKLHGYCVVCGVPWPCETAQTFLTANCHDELVSELQASTNRLYTIINSGLLCDDFRRSLEKQIHFNEAALARAKEIQT